jgi:hypothetical protein
MIDLWFWSLPTARIRGGGIEHSRGGGNDETAHGDDEGSGSS